MFKHLERHQQKAQCLLIPRVAIEKLNPPSPIQHKPLQMNVKNMYLRSKSKKTHKNGLLRKNLELHEKDFIQSHFHNLEVPEHNHLRPSKVERQAPRTESTFSVEKGLKDKNPEREEKTKGNKRQTRTGFSSQKQCRLIIKIKQLKKLNKDKQKTQSSEYQINLNPAKNHVENEEESKKNDNKVGSIVSNNQNWGQKYELFGKEVSQLDSYECESNKSVNSTQSMHLGLQSKLKQPKKILKLSAFVSKVNKLNLSTHDLILDHLKIVDQIYHFLHESINFHSDLEQWKVLHFLLLKKYYIQRLKVLHYLKKFPMKNPFVIEDHEISYKDIFKFMKTEECAKFISQFEEENKKIKRELREFYNKFEKSRVGEKIHLFQYDNFSETIIQELWIEFTLTEYSPDYEKNEINQRLCKILQIIFLISEVNGRSLVSFESGIQAMQLKNYEEYIKQGKKIFEKELQYN